MTFENLSGLISQLNIHDDAIVMDSKIRDLADYFKDTFEDEHELKAVFRHFNRLALDDHRFAMNLAMFFASRILDSVLPSGSLLRSEMLTVLQQNYVDADALKSANPSQFYNSITLLGEYYNRVRISASPLQILGQSLLQLLAAHLRADVDRHLTDAGHRPDVRFAKLILRQITLNGQLVRVHHRVECDELLFECRRCLVLVGNVCERTRALLLMTLDLFYSNFSSLGGAVEALYVTYLVDGDDDDDDADREQHNNRVHPSGVRAPAVAAVDTVVSSINGLGSELSKQASGYQRPGGIKTEYLNRPKRAADRLLFVRQQSAAAEQEQNCETFREQQRSFELTVQQRQQQAPTVAVTDVPDRKLLQPLLLSPSNINANANQPLAAVINTPSPRSSKSCASPRRMRTTGNGSVASVPSSPAKTPQSGRRRPLVAPISPPQNSDWFAEVEAHFAHGVQQARQDVCSPEVNGGSDGGSNGDAGNARNLGNGSPNKYSKSVSPQQQQQQQQQRHSGQVSYSHSHDGENYQQDNGGDVGSRAGERPAFSSPSKRRGDRRRNGGGGGGGRKANNNGSGPNQQRRNNDDDSRYASKASLQSGVSSRLGGGNNEPQQRSGNSGGGGGGYGGSNQLKPANRNNPFDRRAMATSKHHEHCDRGETNNDRRYGNGNGHHQNQQQHRHSSAGDDHYDQYDQHDQYADRTPNAAHINKEFLQFLEN